MTQRKKSFLFVFCSILFVITSIGVILYSQGFRFDLENKKLTQSGAFYFKVMPSSTQIYLNDKFIKRSDFLFNYFFINNLVPKKYEAQIKKDGYFTWAKTLEVKKREVTEVKNVTLFKRSPSFSELLRGTNDFFFINNIIITLEVKSNSWELKSYDPKTNIKSHLLQSADLEKLIPLARPQIHFNNITSDRLTNKIIVETSNNKNHYYFLVKLDVSPISITPLNLPENHHIAFHPQDNQKLLFLNDTILTEINFSSQATPTLLKDVIAFNAIEQNLYHLNSKGFIVKSDFSYPEGEILNKEAFTIKPVSQYQIFIFNDFIFIKEDENLFLLNQESRIFEKFTDKNKGLEISPDLQKLVYFSNNEISVLFLKEQKSQPQKLAQEKMFLTRFSEEIGDVFWVNSHYLIFNIKGNIKIIEIDDRDNINIVDIGEFNSPKIYYNQQDKKLYLLSENNLLVSESLL